MKINNWSILLSAICLSIAIIFQGYISAESRDIKTEYESIAVANAEEAAHIIRISNENQGMTTEEAAEYLSISVEELNTMIEIEDEHLNEYGSFYGMMIPYIRINGEKFFYRSNLDEWLDEATRQHQDYDFKNRIIN